MAASHKKVILQPLLEKHILGTKEDRRRRHNSAFVLERVFWFLKKGLQMPGLQPNHHRIIRKASSGIVDNRNPWYAWCDLDRMVSWSFFFFWGVGWGLRKERYVKFGRERLFHELSTRYDSTIRMRMNAFVSCFKKSPFTWFSLRKWTCSHNPLPILGC